MTDEVTMAWFPFCKTLDRNASMDYFHSVWKAAKNIYFAPNQRVMEHTLYAYPPTTDFKMKMLITATTTTTDDEKCPICMEPFETSQLDFVPEGIYFVEGRGDLCKATLECGHSFNPLAIAYHMLSSGMQCPVCRYGDNEVQLSSSSLPSHIVGIFQVNDPVPLMLLFSYASQLDSFRGGAGQDRALQTKARRGSTSAEGATIPDSLPLLPFSIQ